MPKVNSPDCVSRFLLLPFSAPALHIGGGGYGEFAGVFAFPPVVGYQNVETPTGFSMRTPTFKAINGDVKISDIKVDGAFGMGGEYGQLVNADGTWGNIYYYLTEDGALVPDGWYTDATGENPVTDEDVLAIGQGLFFASDSDVTFTYAGQVIAQPTFDVAAGFSMVGNPSPVTVKISEIVVEGAFGMGGEYGQLINADGTWGNVYYYLTEDGALVPDGWYVDATGEQAVSDEDVLTPSDSMFFAADSDLTFTFPAVL